MPSLTGRVAIVTGAARGIGQEYCCAFAREGARGAIPRNEAFDHRIWHHRLT
jgi:NAD(P)-dependent dehydrogenase (short-subunit alcohol dehydrogenase family)